MEKDRETLARLVTKAMVGGGLSKPKLIDYEAADAILADGWTPPRPAGALDPRAVEAAKQLTKRATEIEAQTAKHGEGWWPEGVAHAAALRLVLSALPAESKGGEVGWRPTHQHVKRGTVYQEIGAVTVQAEAPVADMTELVLYRGEDGRWWARPPEEFVDGRFTPLLAPPPPVQDGGADHA